MTTCVILGQADEGVHIWERRRTQILQEKRNIGFLRCSFNVALRTFASRLLQDSKGLAGSGRGYRGGLSSRAFEVNDTIFAGAEVAHAGLLNTAAELPTV